jgi:hypothetical protein
MKTKILAHSISALDLLFDAVVPSLTPGFSRAALEIQNA